MMKKRFLSMLTATAMLLAMTACGGAGGTNASGADTSGTNVSGVDAAGQDTA